MSRTFRADGTEYTVAVSQPHDGVYTAYAYGPDDAPGDATAVGTGASAEDAIADARRGL